MPDKLPTSDDHREWVPPTARSWVKKFGDAGRGIKIALRAESSFFVHLFATAVVIIAGLVLGISKLAWCSLALVITLVFVAEMCNTALERLARTITRYENKDIRDALDIAGGAVLLAAIGAAIVGLLVLGLPLWELLS